jgi:hypothetical protein
MSQTTCTRCMCLLEAIEGFVQLADVCRVFGVSETRWLCTIHSLIEGAVEEGALHVELIDRLGVGDDNA